MSETDRHLETFAPVVDLPLDPGIRRAVLVLRSGGVETYESCEGGPGHAFPEPTVRFHGTRACGWHALTVALQHGLPVSALRRTWRCGDGEPDGPFWEMTFWKKLGIRPPPARPMQQTCKACGLHDKFNFHVPDEIWAAVVPPELRDLVVCLGCFDGFAKLAGVAYAEHLRELCFVGDQACFDLRAERLSSGVDV